MEDWDGQDWDNFYWGCIFAAIGLWLFWGYVVVPVFQFLCDIHPVCVMVALALGGYVILIFCDSVKKTKSTSETSSD